MQRGRALDSGNSLRPNSLAHVICISAAVFYAGAISAPLVICKTFNTWHSEDVVPARQTQRAVDADETSQAALDALAFQLLAARRNLF
jgi:hypothetical protein